MQGAEAIKPDEKSEPDVELIEANVTFDVVGSTGNFEKDKSIVENLANAFLANLTVDLTKLIGTEITVIYSYYEKGSVDWYFVIGISQEFINWIWQSGIGPGIVSAYIYDKLTPKEKQQVGADGVAAFQRVIEEEVEEKIENFDGNGVLKQRKFKTIKRKIFK